MAIENKRIRVNELDFLGIKDNLKEYLRGQDQFTDFDFEGSAMNVLLDVLAYNTHYNALYQNLAINEMFIDSAAKRSSLASISALLGYTPKSKSAARALVNVTVSNVPNAPGTVTLEGGSPFVASAVGLSGATASFSFFNRSAITTPETNGVYIFENVEIIEGRILENRYQMTDSTRFVLPNSDVDSSTISVTVQETSETVNSIPYTLNSKITNNTAESTVFYLKENENGLLEVYFGDGVVSKRPANGSIVTIEYVVTSAELANGAKVFSYGGAGISGGVVSVQTVSRASGGAPEESNDSIRFNAPRLFQSQDRTVTVEDYKSILPQQYSNVESISVWGGEENDPPVYGKVYLCVKPITGQVLSIAAKQFVIEEVLKQRNLVSITPVLVDPEFLYINVDYKFYYNPTKTKLSSTAISQIVFEEIKNYNDTELVNFDSVFRMSRLSRLIDTSEDSIVSSVGRITLTKPFIPSFGFNTSYEIQTHNPIYNEPGSTKGANVQSSGFRVTGQTQNYFFDDDTQGNLRLYYLSETGIKVYVNNTAGNVNYATGKITISSINMSSAPNNQVSFTIEPASYDVISVRNQLIRVDMTETKVEGISDKIASGEFQSGSDYIFTSNR